VMSRSVTRESRRHSAAWGKRERLICINDWHSKFASISPRI